MTTNATEIPGPDRLPADAGAPLTVLFSFLSRADATPLDQRRRGEGHLLDHQGRVITDPAHDPSINAFEADPNLNFEKWGEYWRKVHGVRFIYQEDVDDRSVERLLRYDQIHRVTAGPTSLTPVPYHPPLDDDGRLFPTIIGHVEPYRRPRWDGVAYLGFASLNDLVAVLATERVRSKIYSVHVRTRKLRTSEMPLISGSTRQSIFGFSRGRSILPEDQTIFRDIAPVLARQFVILPSQTGHDAVALVKTHVRRPDLDRSAFQWRWLHEHANLVLAQADTTRLVRRYVQLHNVGPTVEGEPFFHPETSLIDGVTFMASSTMRDVETFLMSESHAVIAADEQSISTAEAGDYWSGVNFSIVDRLPPEKASKRDSGAA